MSSEKLLNKPTLNEKMTITITTATNKDKQQLIDYLKHYKIKEFIQKRVECYLTHNFTIVAKDDEKIAGMLQWHVKEDPDDGLAEFEEVHVMEDYRGKGIGTKMVKYAVQSVKEYFKKLGFKPRKIFLFVGKDNQPGRALYEKQGFKYAADVGNLFHDDEVELFYVLNID